MNLNDNWSRCNVPYGINTSSDHVMAGFLKYNRKAKTKKVVKKFQNQFQSTIVISV